MPQSTSRVAVWRLELMSQTLPTWLIVLSTSTLLSMHGGFYE